jgi:hypothetical protein
VLCDRCGKLIEGEPERIAPDSATGAAPDVVIHPWDCTGPPPVLLPSGPYYD